MEKVRVLIVDDSQVARRLLVTQLAELGFASVAVAQNGEQAMQLLVESRTHNMPFGLIITDLRMPTMNGTDLLAKLNGDPEFKHIPKLISSVETDRAVVLN